MIQRVDGKQHIVHGKKKSFSLENKKKHLCHISEAKHLSGCLGSCGVRAHSLGKQPNTIPMHPESGTCIWSAFATLHFSNTFVVFVCLSHIFERSLHATLAKVSLLSSFKQLQRNLFCRSRCKILQLSYYFKTMRSLSAVLTSSILS